MADVKQIIELYSELVDKPNKDFGWDKGIENAKAHNYSKEWFEKLPLKVWDYCAAVGNPFEQADIQEGSTVVDLGCGAGVDLLVSALLVGENGKAIGVDITPKMVKKAKEHAALAGFINVDVLESSFDDIDLEDESVDVVISNGAINLTSCKESVFAEIYRILKPNGKIYFADMIDISENDDSCSDESSCCISESQDWANCVAGTLQKDKLIEIISKAGFRNVECTGLTHYKTSDTTCGATFKAAKIASDELREAHWDNIFKTKDYTQVLWHQNSPDKSLDLIKKSNIGKKSSIIDVGCGASYLVDKLVEDGYKDITLLDTSATSLEIVKGRLWSHADIVEYICSDIMNYESSKKFDIWHDRAVFHFLVLKKERAKYFEVLQNSLQSGAIAIINTFATDGPIQCAGLDIVQYDKEKMLQELPSGLELMEYDKYIHHTPKNTDQKYSCFVIKKA
ncbi:protein containing Methyltransferase type 11 domain [Sulfurimonas gotlandica GD1]|jgi:arsenite methyltransferase|uniref:Protein containing Methyltransferase type 11 domain n=1 Tax=Sulfurimonas gotlandica (strain DSM 19862 / JCM 16533 / GD1) TaxID=929558 RepID=B6BHZ8_SULGG|nr:class I SAM-dependent methyltransferase [Sulfurimonas gotlandica]EDZ63007.1 Methyltransferase domain family protein [Sulfurimonas gotlandica GD1]EHP30150.1 protein containing Methyltransferase type 11 domain [Sulfurimonas gotlandica GD1]